MTYVGWVPIASGEVSYGSIGTHIVNGPVFRLYAQTQTSTKIVFGLCRKNVDKILPNIRSAWRRVMNHGLPKEHNIAYFMVAEAQDDRLLKGRIYFFPCGDPKKFIDGFNKRVITGGQAHKFTTAEQYIAGQSSVRGLGNLNVAFTLLKNGKVFIENDGGLDPAVFSKVARHLYFFVKDGVHKHYHHHGESDGILEVVDQTGTYDWRIVIKRNLHDKIIALRHIQDAESLSNALGVLAYAKSFIRLFGTSDFDENGALIAGAAVVPGLSDEIEASIQLRLAAIITNDSKRYSDATFFIGIIVAIIGLWFSWLQIADYKSRMRDAISHLSSLNVIIGAFVLGIALWVIFDLSSRKRDFNKNVVMSNLYRLMSPLDKDLHLNLIDLLLVIIFLAAVGAGWFLFWQFPIPLS